MKKLQIIILLSVNLFVSVVAQTSWQSALLSVDNSGNLTYKSDSKGFIIPDFSHAGYMGGGVDIPVVPVVKEISAIPGDNTQHIQDAIDYVGSLPLNNQGIRGALLLKAGRYHVFGTLYVKYDGVVLRGVGQGEESPTSTIIYAGENIS